MAPINPANLLERLAQALDGAAPLALVPGIDQATIPQGAALVLGTAQYTKAGETASVGNLAVSFRDNPKLAAPFIEMVVR